MANPERTIGVYGGYGFFGRHVVDDLLAFTDCRILAVGRRPPPVSPWASRRVELVTSDQHDARSVATVLEKCAVVLHCAGPYQGLSCDLLRSALSLRIPYVDLADARDFRQRVESLVRDSTPEVPILTGMSFVPGLAAVLVALVQDRFDRIDSIRSFAAPGTHSSRGSATFLSLLSGAGRRLSVPRRGGSVRCEGWSEPERVDLPPPLGRRTTYLAIEVADFDLFPQWFGAGSVEFKAGSEFAWLNRLLFWSARLRATIGTPHLERISPLVGSAIKLMGRFGTDAGAGMVEVTGNKAGRSTIVRIALVARDRDPRIPAVPAAIAAQGILTSRVKGKGLIPLHRAFDLYWFITELRRRGLELDGRRRVERGIFLAALRLDRLLVPLLRGGAEGIRFQEHRVGRRLELDEVARHVASVLVAGLRVGIEGLLDDVDEVGGQVGPSWRGVLMSPF